MPVRYFISPNNRRPELRGSIGENQPAIKDFVTGPATVAFRRIAETMMYLVKVTWEEGADVTISPPAGVVDVLGRQVDNNRSALEVRLRDLIPNPQDRLLFVTKMTSQSVDMGGLSENDPVYLWLNRLLNKWEPGLDFRDF